MSCLATLSARAEVKPNQLFSDGAVLQQGMALPVWGTANDGEEVTVKFQNQAVTTTTLEMPPPKNPVRAPRIHQSRNCLLSRNPPQTIVADAPRAA